MVVLLVLERGAGVLGQERDAGPNLHINFFSFCNLEIFKNWKTSVNLLCEGEDVFNQTTAHRCGGAANKEFSSVKRICCYL